MVSLKRSIGIDNLNSVCRFLRDNLEKSSPINKEIQIMQKHYESILEENNFLKVENARLKEEVEAFKAKYVPLSSDN